MMTEKNIIAVVAAPRAQRGGWGRGRERASQGAEVIEAGLDDEASLRKAFDGAYGAYVVTNFWAQRTPEQEQARTRAHVERRQAAAAARAAKDAELRHVV